MRPHEVIDFSPSVELALRLGEIAELAVVQQLQPQGSMEALVLALGLRMTRSAMKDHNAQAHEPDFQGAVGLGARGAERRSVGGQDAQRQAVGPEHRAYPLARGALALI